LSKVIVVAPLTVQDKVADWPKVMVAEELVNTEIIGAEPVEVAVVNVWSVEVARLFEPSVDLTL